MMEIFVKRLILFKFASDMALVSAPVSMRSSIAISSKCIESQNKCGFCF